MDIGRSVVDIREFDRNRLDWCHVIYHNPSFNQTNMLWEYNNLNAKATIFDTTFEESKFICKNVPWHSTSEILDKSIIRKAKIYIEADTIITSDSKYNNIWQLIF